MVMTAAQVVKDVDLIRVRFNDETYPSATLISIANQSDVALLQLDKPRAYAVVAELSNSDTAMVGSPAFIVAAAYGFTQTLNVG